MQVLDPKGPTGKEKHSKQTLRDYAGLQANT